MFTSLAAESGRSLREIHKERVVLCEPISSLAIAGAWGYIGRKFVEAAQELGLDIRVFDPGPPPLDLDLHGVRRFDSEQQFFQQQADLFYLALHPEQRTTGMRILLQRSQHESLFVLCEKPMAAPQAPEQCRQIVDAVAGTEAVWLYDFPELFDPITKRILDFFACYDDVQISSITMQRSKDREDPAIARNAKRMVHIQYQESIHCLAFALYILAHVSGGLERALADGLMLKASAEPYLPPNPAAYNHIVDGKCEYHLTIGDVQIAGRTDFKRGAPWGKRRGIRGKVDGRPFKIVVDFLEGKKLLFIDDKPHDAVIHTNSYAEVIKGVSRLRQQATRSEILTGIYPHPAFARLAYQLSSALWRSSWEKKWIILESQQELLDFDARFAEALPLFGAYGRLEV